MTIRLIFAIAVGFALGFPLGVFLAIWKATQAVMKHQREHGVPYTVRVDEDGIPESVSLAMPEEAERRMRQR